MIAPQPVPADDVEVRPVRTRRNVDIEERREKPQCVAKAGDPVRMAAAFGQDPDDVAAMLVEPSVESDDGAKLSGGVADTVV